MDSSSDDEPLANVKKKKIKIKVKAEPVTSSSTPKSTDAAKKRKRESGASSASSGTKKKAKVKVEEGSGSKSKQLKKLDRAERLQYAMQSFLWWEATEPPPGFQWLKMEHAGVSFPETYIPHGVKMNYNGEPIELTPLQEEA